MTVDYFPRSNSPVGGPLETSIKAFIPFIYCSRCSCREHFPSHVGRYLIPDYYFKSVSTNGCLRRDFYSFNLDAHTDGVPSQAR